MMNEPPEGYEIVEARNMHDLKVGDMLGGIVVKKIDGGLIALGLWWWLA